MNYQEMEEEQSKKLNEFYKAYGFFACDDSQFKEGMKKLGLEENETNKIISIGYGGYILKSSIDNYHNLIDSLKAEKEKLFLNDDFLYKAIRYELYNHEYFVFEDPEPTLNALGFRIEELETNKRLKNIFVKASKDYMKNY